MADVIDAPRMLSQPIEGPGAWTASALSASDWLVPIPPDAMAELQAIVAELRRSPLPVFVLDPADYQLGACRALMAGVRDKLRRGALFAVLDRLPADAISRDEMTALYWILSSLIARPVAQKLNGLMMFDVRDTGAKLRPGSGIRPTVTNVDLTFHNDNSYNETPPDYVCLLCLQKARDGGISRVISMQTVHNILLRENPAALARLYRPFWHDRHAEHFDGEPRTHAAPLFEYDGATLKARIAIGEIRGGYALRDEALDPDGEAALHALQDIFARPEIRMELDFQPGQIQYVNNRLTGHARTEFADAPEPERKRHLVRLWLRERGKRGYRG